MQVLLLSSSLHFQRSGSASLKTYLSRSHSKRFVTSTKQFESHFRRLRRRCITSRCAGKLTFVVWMWNLFKCFHKLRLDLSLQNDKLDCKSHKFSKTSFLRRSKRISHELESLCIWKSLRKCRGEIYNVEGRMTVSYLRSNFSLSLLAIIPRVDVEECPESWENESTLGGLAANKRLALWMEWRRLYE